MKPKVYIDGREGTTGLQIFDRLTVRNDIDLLLIDEDKRKDPAERKKLINMSDVTFLCLPDVAAREAVALCENENTIIIDASTAHRTADGWAYGFPELSQKHRELIKRSKRIANPGCHATGFISIAYPLITLGILPETCPLTCFSLTGYSGGGKKMIAEYESPAKPEGLFAPNIYGLNLRHKHLAEMIHVTGLSREPLFVPVVDDYYRGMATSMTLHSELLCMPISARAIHGALSEYYDGEHFLTVEPFTDTGKLRANYNAGTNMLNITVCGTERDTLITARFDNLGKGASGAAVQNMNLVLGFRETDGL
jgi:N-acetyl-gamma-glutamyl-phosphate reductase